MKMKIRTIEDFVAYSAMFPDGGAMTSYRDRLKNEYTITSDGNDPQKFAINGLPTDLEDLKRVTRGRKLLGFYPL